MGVFKSSPREDGFPVQAFIDSALDGTFRAASNHHFESLRGEFDLQTFKLNRGLELCSTSDRECDRMWKTIPTASVTCTITINGKPVQVSKSNRSEAKVRPSIGMTDANGRYKAEFLSTQSRGLPLASAWFSFPSTVVTR